MLLQVDGSRHDWLQGRGPFLTLIGAADDATGTVPSALFRQQEAAHGYLLMLRHIIERHGIFQRSPKEPESLQEQLRGRRDSTQFGRALEELGITLILAHTPQAKGRIERAWGAFQDRLVSELRLAGASTIDQANKVLWDFLPRFNQRFGVEAAQPGLAYRQLADGLSLDETLCFKYLRTVANDNTVRFNGTTLQLLPDARRASYARANVEVHERLDGSLVMVYQGKTLAAVPAPSTPVTLRARNGRRSNGASSPKPTPDPHSVDREHQPSAHDLQTTNTNPQRPTKPPPDHPWRRPLLTKSLNN